MEIVAVIAFSVALIFARLALMQELNPFLWGALAVVVYAGAPVYLIRRGAGLSDAPMLWLSSYIGLFILFVLQSVVATRKRFRDRGGPPVHLKGKGKRKKGKKKRPGGGKPEGIREAE